MSETAAARLRQLVPAIYRNRDLAFPGRPLDGLLGLLGGELDRLRLAVRTLGDDHFVERASPEALLLLADLFGARLLGRDPRVNRGVLARTIAWRRRRGTLPTLEEVLAVTSGWDAEVEEAYRSLAHTQELGNLSPNRGRTAILWDPIATADPLSRRAPSVALPPRGVTPPAALAERAEDETLDQALRRLGRADAGRHAASPRTLDLAGWARPEVAVIRTARLSPLEIEGVEPGPRVRVPTPDPLVELTGFRLDPLDRDQPLVWLQPHESPDSLPSLTAIHEPASETESAATLRRGATLLTPTALAADGDLAESQGALEIHLDGVQLIGPESPPEPRAMLPFQPLGLRPVLRFADPARPDPGDDWGIKLIAHQPAGDRVMAAAGATPGTPGPLLLDESARTELHGASVRLRLRRYAGGGRLRDGGGDWTPLGEGIRLGPPLSPLVPVPAQNGETHLYRMELHEAEAALRLARLPLAAPDWTPLTLTGDVPAPEPGARLALAGGDLLLVIPERDLDAALTDMGLYLLEPNGAEAQATRRVAENELSPPARTGAAVAVHGARLYLFGGNAFDGLQEDLWSIATDGSEPGWTPHPVRNPQQRSGATLLSTPGGLLLIGGEAESGGLAADCWLLDPTAPRPRWEPLPPLPFEAGRPGTLAARHDGAATEALVWADHTRPRLCRLADGAEGWEAGPAEAAACNPPAAGEALFAGPGFVVAGPPPLPPSEVILSVGGESVLAMLPTLDLVPRPLDANETLLADEALNPGLPPDAYVGFEIASDGSSWRVQGDDPALHTRVGGALHVALSARLADRPRLGVPGRLARHFFRLRQRSLGAWEQPYVLDHDELVGLDPRLGRVLLPQGVRRGRIRVSYRVGRGAAIGSGMMPPDRAIPEHWREPDLAVPTPPDLRPDSGPEEPRFGAWVDPQRAGQTLTSGGVPIPVFEDLESAAAYAGEASAIAMLGSAQVPPARLTAGLTQGISIVASDFGGTPIIQADPADGSALALHPEHAGGAATAIWLAGLWLGGRLDLAMARGEADLRWCTLGTPGEPSIRLPGGGHQGLLTRRTLPPVTLELRLYGCQLGVLQIPPWVRLIAAGCTFDAGSRDAVAIQGFGAGLRLRHCTVHGGVQAGELRASSCAFAGRVLADRTDRGWLRHCLVPAGGRTPQRYRCIETLVAFSSTRPTDPGYLVPADNNAAAALHAGELGRLPGAHSERQGRLLELTERTADFLPIGMTAHHTDRTTGEINRMNRTHRRLP